MPLKTRQLRERREEKRNKMVKSLAGWKGRGVPLTIIGGKKYKGKVVSEFETVGYYNRTGTQPVYFFETTEGERLRISSKRIKATSEGGLVMELNDLENLN